MSSGVDGATVVVVVATAASALVAVGGWAVHAGERRREPAAPGERRRPPAFPPAAALIVVALALVSVPIGPRVAVFSVVVALNHLLGRGENVPFSTYPMFARPDRRSWSIRFEASSGAVVSTTAFGMIPPVVRRRFSSELEAARAETGDLRRARRLAAASLAATLERRRPRTGPLATETVSIVLVEYDFDGEALRATRTPLAVCAPP